MIKFRAWDKLSNMMYTPTSIKLINGEVVQADIEDNSLNISDDLNTLLLEQFTGLKDKQGVEIYNGDILHFGSVWCVGDEYDPREEEHIGAIEYRPDYASYVVNCNGKIFPLEQVISFDGYSVEGNVHENVEVTENEL
ncbi:hypothetical protein IMAU80009_03381 [Lactiplantibacillus plantarum]|nr:hypothetical protein [Lactiplantibacillus plantarum]